MVEIEVKCIRCGNEFPFNTDDYIEPMYKGDEIKQRVFHNYCPYCGKLNKIEISY